jgi:TolB-like protein
MVNDDNTVTARPVTAAYSENDKSAITSGLVAGDKVVVEGQLRLKDGTKVKVSGPLIDSSAAEAIESSGKTKSHDAI